MTEYKAKSVHECWQIAFDYAEELQELLNLDGTSRHLRVHIQGQRDAASEIAWRIKFGERKESK